MSIQQLLDEALPFSAVFAQTFPIMLVALVAVCGWWLLCRYLMRNQDAAFTELVRQPDDLGTILPDKQLVILSVQHRFIGYGKPSDRLFFAGLTTASVIVLMLLVARFVLSAHL